ncbi:MAG: TonB-dependent receptor plug domain-containing protein, partial [Prevotellaceae bacterium]|nr:TonB-dependent receptor plug domain-containing protein [Prevotellaceae bacterium]
MGASISAEDALQGRTSGFEVTSISGTFGSVPKLRVRGASSIYGNSQPLVVIDGVVTEMEMANPQNIESIEVLKDAAATSIYGARAMNGVILITTKHGLSRTSSIKPKQRFGGVVVKKNNNREFYKSAYFVQNTHNPDQTSSTVFWNGNVETDKNGKAEISFRNNLQSSVFRITAEGFAPNNGLIGAAKKKIVTSKPLSVDMKLPLFAAVGDTIIVPVMVRNVTDKSLNVLVDFAIITQDSAFLRKIGNDTLAENAITILPNETFTVNIPVVSDKDGSGKIKVSVKTSIYEDDIAQNISTYRAGFPYSYAFSGKDAGQTQQF